MASDYIYILALYWNFVYYILKLIGVMVWGPVRPGADSEFEEGGHRSQMFNMKHLKYLVHVLV